ncbi:MAG: aminotransferase [Lentisphaeria bacterium]|nr:aminotransferase [Lentisphaeria bacterium]
MSAIPQLSPEALRQLAAELRVSYARFQSQGLNLDITRGKPCTEQLDLANGMLAGCENEYVCDGVDGRNYGGVDGLPAMKAFFADFLEAPSAQVIVGGNSSLALMHDTVLRLLLKGVSADAPAWKNQGPVKFLCPVPGYDRHFAICETFDIEMITVPMGPDGPDMDEVERLAAADPAVKGIWCIPKYSNPTGITYSDEIVDRLAAMPTAADDFRIFWDNAYAVHHLTDTPDRLKNILSACENAGHPDRVYVFGSTSKVTFAGAGLGAMAASEANIAWLTKLISIQTIGPDKMSQIRHLLFLKDMAAVDAHMKKHAAIIKPKFDVVLSMLRDGLGATGCAAWNEPRGGYFVSVDTLPGCAARTGALAAQAGVKLTPAGATFPYGKDPEDRNIRIAPTLPSLAVIKTAMELFILCVKIASVETLLDEKIV